MAAAEVLNPTLSQGSSAASDMWSEDEEDDDGRFACDEDGDVDDEDGAREEYYVGPDTSARKWAAGGGAKSLDADLAGLAAHGYKGAWRVSAGSEVCVAIEVPYSRFGLSTELAHSLRLEPGCVVVVKMRAQVRPGGSPVLLEPGVDKRLPVLRFTVLKAKPGMLSDILQQRSAQDAAQPTHAEFGLRYSLENMLQSFFLSMLAVESDQWHRPHAIAESCSLVYVRNCVNKGLGLGSDRYMSADNLQGKDEALKAALAETQTGPRCALMHTEAHELQLALQNHLLRLARFVREQLELSSQYCLVCHAPTAVRGIKPFVCASPLCLHQWQELSLGANPELEVEQNPEVVDLLLSLFYVHAVNGTSEEAGLLPTWKSMTGWVPCSGTLRSGVSDATNLRGHGTFFKAQVLKGDAIRVVPRSPDGRPLAEQTRKVKSVETDESLTLEEPFSCHLEDICFHRIRDSDDALWDLGFAAANVLDGTPLRIWCCEDRPSSLPAQPPKGRFGGMPPVSTMREWVNKGDSLRNKLDELDGRLYPLLRWVLCSMRGHLRFVDGDADEGIPQLAHLKQFVLLCSKPETEATFQELAKTNEVKFAFHGSPVSNWHSILRNGLNFNKTTHGRAYGHGIYMATNAATSMGYMGGNVRASAVSSTSQTRKGSAAFARCRLEGSTDTASGWQAQSMFKSNFSCMAVCEVIYRPSEFVSTTPHWVVDKLEWVVTRYLCVQVKETAAAGSSPPPAQPPQHPGNSMNVAASSLTIKTTPLTASPRGSAADDVSGDGGDGAGGASSADENGLCQMFPQFEPAMVQSVLLSVNGDTDEAVMVLSSMAASAPRSHSDGSEGGQKKRSRGALSETIVDLTADSDDDDSGGGEASVSQGVAAAAAAAEGAAAAAASAASAASAAPSESSSAQPSSALVDEVLAGTAAMGLQLERSDAIRLLRCHHCHVSDAIAAAFG